MTEIEEMLAWWNRDDMERLEKIVRDDT